MGKTITFCEGECERSLLTYLKRDGYRFGRIMKQVIDEIVNVERVLHMVNSKTNVIIIIDTDTLYSGNFNKTRFYNNVMWLSKKSKSLKIITQNKNLEDELKKSLEFDSDQKLYTHFNAVSITEYKSKLAGITESSSNIKFKDIDLNKLWNFKVSEIFDDNTQSLKVYIYEFSELDIYQD